MPTIDILIKNKIAQSPTDVIVCGNSDFKIKFHFETEWDEFSVKTARFVYNGKSQDVVFNGNIVDVPIISGANCCSVGVYAGNLHTTTPALIQCRKSILCEDGAPVEPSEDVYNQIMQEINNIAGLTSTQIAALDGLFKIIAYTENAASAYKAFRDAFGLPEEHTHNYTATVTAEATCTTDGELTYTCTCGDSYSETIKATGHTYLNGMCTVCGAQNPDYRSGYELYHVVDVTKFVQGGLTQYYSYNGSEIPYINTQRKDRVSYFPFDIIADSGETYMFEFETENSTEKINLEFYNTTYMDGVEKKADVSVEDMVSPEWWESGTEYTVPTLINGQPCECMRMTFNSGDTVVKSVKIYKKVAS